MIRHDSKYGENGSVPELKRVGWFWVLGLKTRNHKILVFYRPINLLFLHWFSSMADFVHCDNGTKEDEDST